MRMCTGIRSNDRPDQKQDAEHDHNDSQQTHGILDNQGCDFHMGSGSHDWPSVDHVLQLRLAYLKKRYPGVLPPTFRCGPAAQ